MSIRVLIVDDEPLARERVKSFLLGESDVEIIGQCANGPEALRVIREQSPDLVFLDVQMPGMTGLEVLRALDREKLPAIIFVTAHDKHAMEAFEFHALDYLLKPYNQARFKQALDWARKQLEPKTGMGVGDQLKGRLLKLLEESQNSESETLSRLAIKNAGKVSFLPVAEIDWIESAGNYLAVHSGKETHLIRETLGGLEEKLPSKRFVRVSRSALVNIDRVKELEPLGGGDHVLFLRDGTRIPVTRPLREIEDLLKFG